MMLKLEIREKMKTRLNNILIIIFFLMVIMTRPGYSEKENDKKPEPQIVSMSTLFEAGDLLWKMPQNEFLKKYAQKYKFHWVSADRKDSIRSVMSSLTFLDFKVHELLVSFKDGKIGEIRISFFNRGDTGEIKKTEFERLVRTVQEAITSWTGERQTKGPQTKRLSSVRKESAIWTRKQDQAKLEWSYSTGSKRKDGFTYRPEYINFQIQAFDKSKDYRSRLAQQSKSKSTVSLSKLKSSIKKESNGDIFIQGIPMVNQGQKGYCAVATAERIMRYYGRDIDQHQLAQLAQTGTGGGTSPAAMINALRKLGLSLGCKVESLMEFKVMTFLKLIDDYNKVAKKRGKKVINYENLKVLNAGAIYNDMDADALKESRLKKKADMDKFQKFIKKYIDKGIPLVLSVMLGKIEEKEIPQARGGHMRLIIGYNLKSKEIIYSDTWGSGHEFKKMSMEDVWCITTGLYTVEPRYTSF
ncbi:C39 family peptidase [Verrucomicrobiota bacterium]